MHAYDAPAGIERAYALKTRLISKRASFPSVSFLCAKFTVIAIRFASRRTCEPFTSLHVAINPRRRRPSTPAPDYPSESDSRKNNLATLSQIKGNGRHRSGASDERINSVWNSDECINSLLTLLYKMLTLRINNASRAEPAYVIFSRSYTRVCVRARALPLGISCRTRALNYSIKQTAVLL